MKKQIHLQTACALELDIIVVSFSYFGCTDFDYSAMIVGLRYALCGSTPEEKVWIFISVHFRYLPPSATSTVPCNYGTMMRKTTMPE